MLLKLIMLFYTTGTKTRLLKVRVLPDGGLTDSKNHAAVPTRHQAFMLRHNARTRNSAKINEALVAGEIGTSIYFHNYISSSD